MIGDRILIDTNIIINLLNGIEGIKPFLKGRELCVSIITEMELLSYTGIQANDIKIIKTFLSECIIIDINNEIKELAITLRRRTKMKLPDSIIAASAIYMEIPLFTADKAFKRFNDLTCVIIES